MKTTKALASVIILFAVLSATSCVKDDILEVSDCSGNHEVVFDIDNGDATRLSLDADSPDRTVNWDKIPKSYVHLYENGKEGTAAKINVDKKGNVSVSALFSVLNFITNKGYTYNCVIAGDYENNVISVPVTQRPAGGCCDPAADVILATSSYSGAVRPIITGLKLNFERRSSLTRLTLSGMNAGEKVKSIEIAADKFIAGPFIKLNGTEFAPYSAEGSKRIWLEFTEDNTVAADGTFVTYFSSLVTEVNSLSVRVVTDNSTYAKSFPVGNGRTFIFSSCEINNADLTFTAEDIRHASQEMTFNLENNSVGRFLDVAGSVYTDANWSSTTVVTSYCRENYSSSTREDIPNPVVLDWTGTASGKMTVTIYNDSDRTDIETSLVTSSSSAEIYNLIPGRKYWYTVATAAGSDVKSGSFNTTGRRRMMLIGKKTDYDRYHANNCRDFGGQKTTDGRTVRYDKIFRGSNMDLTTSAQRSYLKEYMNIDLDVNLRETKGLNPLGVKQSNQNYNSWKDLSNTSRMKATLQDIFDAVNSGKAVYIHCAVGADRTGYVSLLLEAILGVSQKDCSIDYELTSFSCVGIRARSGQGNVYFTQGMQFLEGLSGATFQQKAVNYVVNTLSIRPEVVAAFQNNMLE